MLGGGAVWREEVTRVLSRLRDTGLPFNADVVAHGDPDVPRAGTGQRFTISGRTLASRNDFAAADLVVSAAEVTLLEACCIGVPIALVLLVDNQEAGYRAAVEQGFAVGLGRADTLHGATEALVRLLGDPPGRRRHGVRRGGRHGRTGCEKRVLEAVPAG